MATVALLREYVQYCDIMGIVAGVGREQAVHNSPSLKSCVGVCGFSQKKNQKMRNVCESYLWLSEL